MTEEGTAMTDYTTMTDAELQQILADVSVEVNRRALLVAIPDQIADLNADYLAAEGTAEGEPWRQPTGSHDAYPLDWIVTHNEGEWRSLVSGNVWEPGVSGWAVEGGGDWPMWVQPTGGHDAYQIGAQVTHLDIHWTSDVDANVWEPGVYGWTDTEEE
jgi:hypothetical protein